MTFARAGRMALVLLVLIPLAACGRGSIGSGFGSLGGIGGTPRDPNDRSGSAVPRDERLSHLDSRTTLGQLFAGNADPNVTVGVNKYLWRASLDILNFLPIEAVDPFTGVIVTGYGAPPGGGRAYRATIYIQDPALDARSLRVALQARGGGAVSRETHRAVEDAILTRARQLRVADSRL
ncbi:MAG: DUF3576 domain-containing protein [Paracoccaceae bacterium]|nr:MAG: DUF3576 domain-containing protein [Paracoccaceae bacterium]